MKFKDYYAILGVERGASEDDIKKAYRKLARKYHPDVSKEANAEARFKEMAEAYATLKDPEKRAAYDQLGRHGPGEEFRPPPGWSTQFGETASAFDEMDLADLFAGLAGRHGRGARRGPAGAMRGQDYEVEVPITLEDAFRGTEVGLDLTTTEFDEQGVPHRRPRSVKARIPKGATDGQVLRLQEQGGKGAHGGRDGDVYIKISLRPHRLFRVSGHDLYVDVPLLPWEAALGTEVRMPTLGGTVNLKVPAGTPAGRQLRLAGRGLPTRRGGAGDLYAIIQLAMPPELTERERGLLRELAAASSFNPRRHLE
jgi:curved DNA-binding protein